MKSSNQIPIRKWLASIYERSRFTNPANLAAEAYLATELHDRGIEDVPPEILDGTEINTKSFVSVSQREKE